MTPPEDCPPPNKWVPTSTEDLKRGMVVSGMGQNQNRYGVESVSRAKFSQFGRPSRNAFVVVIGLPGTNGGVWAVRCFRDDTWYVWKDEA